MPYLYSPELAIPNCLPIRQKGIDEQFGTATKVTRDITHWLTEIGSWAPTIDKASSARSASIHLGDNDVESPQTTDLTLELPSRSFDGGLEGCDWYRWSGYWSTSVAKWDEWRTENNKDTSEDAEAEVGTIIENGRVGDVDRLGAIKVETCRQSGAAQRSGGVQIQVDGPLLSTRREERGAMLLRWLTESSEAPWHPGKVDGVLQ
jgi:hypothetical protein